MGSCQIVPVSSHDAGRYTPAEASADAGGRIDAAPIRATIRRRPPLGRDAQRLREVLGDGARKNPSAASDSAHHLEGYVRVGRKHPSEKSDRTSTFKEMFTLTYTLIIAGFSGVTSAYAPQQHGKELVKSCVLIRQYRALRSVTTGRTGVLPVVSVSTTAERGDMKIDPTRRTRPTFLSLSYPSSTVSLVTAPEFASSDGALRHSPGHPTDHQRESSQAANDPRPVTRARRNNLRGIGARIKSSAFTGFNGGAASSPWHAAAHRQSIARSEVSPGDDIEGTTGTSSEMPSRTISSVAGTRRSRPRAFAGGQEFGRCNAVNLGDRGGLLRSWQPPTSLDVTDNSGSHTDHGTESWLKQPEESTPVNRIPLITRNLDEGLHRNLDFQDLGNVEQLVDLRDRDVAFPATQGCGTDAGKSRQLRDGHPRFSAERFARRSQTTPLEAARYTPAHTSPCILVVPNSGHDAPPPVICY